MERQRARPESVARQATVPTAAPPTAAMHDDGRAVRLPRPARQSHDGPASPADSGRTSRRARPAAGGSGGAGAPKGSPTRFTSTGTGVALLLLSLVAGAVDHVVSDGFGVVFGVGFLLACLVAAARVRSSDLVAAPACAPVAFAVALAVTIPGEGGGMVGRGVTVGTALAVNAGWLYGGTLLAAALAVLRHTTLKRGGGARPGGAPAASGGGRASSGGGRAAPGSRAAGGGRGASGGGRAASRRRR